MAAITSASSVYISPDVSERLAVYAVRNVTTGDTFDTTAQFSRVFRATFFPTTNQGLAASATVAGTVVTFNASGLAGDGGYLVVQGEGPQ